MKDFSVQIKIPEKVWKEYKEETKEDWKEMRSFLITLALFPFRLLISPLSLITYSIGYVLKDLSKNFQELAGDSWFVVYVFALVGGWMVAVPVALLVGFFRTLRYVITGRKIERPQPDNELKEQNTTLQSP